MKLTKILTLAFWLVCLAGLTAEVIEPPLAPALPDSVLVHNIWLRNDYGWLKDRDNPLVADYLRQEIAYADIMLNPSAALTAVVYNEFVSRLVPSEISQPYFYRGYWYYTRTEAGKAYTIHCRKQTELSSPEQVILDENVLSIDKEFFAVGTFSISPDQRYLAYSVDEDGSELYSLFIKDLKTGKTRKTDFSNVSEAQWMADSKTLILTLVNDRMQTDTALRWNFKTGKRKILYQESDPGWDIGVYANCDETMLLLSCSSKDASETHWLPADGYDNDFTCLLPRREHHNYDTDYFQGKFYLRSNLFQPDYDILVCGQDSSSIEKCSLLYQGSSGSPIESFLLMADHLVVLQRKGGSECLFTADMTSGAVQDTIMTEAPSDLGFWVNPSPNSKFFYYQAENEISPPAIYRFDFGSHKSELIRTYLPAGEFDPGNYSSIMVKVIARDGTFIPLRLTFRTDLDLSAPNPLKLYAYGAYGDCEDPYFSSTNLSYLDRGVILATALVRGGGEFGQAWYDGGRLLNKKNTFYDFIDCMDFLIEQGITTPTQLIIEGGSAGGLLMGAVANLAYDKCALVIADVPFVDLMQTMLDSSLPLTIQEYEEWGNPADSVYFAYMLSYSPVDNVLPHPYPTILINCAWNDTRVGYWEAVKWAARLRKANTGANPVILRINRDEGHTGQADRYRFLRSYADTVGYVLWKSGLE